MTLTNGGAIPHSIDFHAARIAPNVAFKDVMPGDSFTFRFDGRRPRRLHVPLRHEAGARPHRQRHVRRDRRRARRGRCRPVDNEYVLVASEWYLNGDGIDEPASLDMAKARAMTPDWTTFNGYANQYVTHPLTADPGETTRF